MYLIALEDSISYNDACFDGAAAAVLVHGLMGRRPGDRRALLPLARLGLDNVCHCKDYPAIIYADLAARPHNLSKQLMEDDNDGLTLSIANALQ